MDEVQPELLPSPWLQSWMADDKGDERERMAEANRMQIFIKFYTNSEKGRESAKLLPDG